MKTIFYIETYWKQIIEFFRNFIKIESLRIIILVFNVTIN